MDFFLRRGVAFKEQFNFKNDKGKPLPVPGGLYKIILERGTFAREYRANSGLSRLRSALVWEISAEESLDFEFSTMYYTLYLNDQEVTRGVLKIQ